jgi:hypothetical protein
VQSCLGHKKHKPLAKTGLGGVAIAIALSTVPHKLHFEYAVEEAVRQANLREGPEEQADKNLNQVARLSSLVEIVS